MHITKFKARNALENKKNKNLRNTRKKTYLNNPIRFQVTLIKHADGLGKIILRLSTQIH